MVKIKLKDILKDIKNLDKSIELEFTNYCNAICNMCPREKLSRKKGYLTPDTLMNIINAAKNYNVNNISIGGFGEPLLHKNFIPLFSILKTELPDITISITTNGYLFSPEIQQKIIEIGIPEINISFHSPNKEKYEKIMGISFSRVIENVTYFLKTYPNYKNVIRIGIVKTKQNVNEVNEIIDFWTNIGVSHFTILTAHNRAGKLLNQELIDEEFYNLQKIDIREEDKILCKKPSCILKFIDWQGKVHICCNDLEDQALLGSLKEDGFDEMENKREQVWSGIQKTLCSDCNMPSVLLETELISIE